MTDRRWGDRQANGQTDDQLYPGYWVKGHLRLKSYIVTSEVFLWLTWLNLGLGFFVMDGYGTLYSPETIGGPQHLYGREISKFMSIQDLWVRLEMPSKNIIVARIYVCIFCTLIPTWIDWILWAEGAVCSFAPVVGKHPEGFFHDVNTTAACQCSERVSG